MHNTIGEYHLVTGQISTEARGHIDTEGTWQCWQTISHQYYAYSAIVATNEVSTIGEGHTNVLCSGHYVDSEIAEFDK